MESTRSSAQSYASETAVRSSFSLVRKQIEELQKLGKELALLKAEAISTDTFAKSQEKLQVSFGTIQNDILKLSQMYDKLKASVAESIGKLQSSFKQEEQQFKEFEQENRKLFAELASLKKTTIPKDEFWETTKKIKKSIALLDAKAARRDVFKDTIAELRRDIGIFSASLDDKADRTSFVEQLEGISSELGLLKRVALTEDQVEERFYNLTRAQQELKDELFLAVEDVVSTKTYANEMRQLEKNIQALTALVEEQKAELQVLVADTKEHNKTIVQLERQLAKQAGKKGATSHSFKKGIVDFFTEEVEDEPAPKKRGRKKP